MDPTGSSLPLFVGIALAISCAAIVLIAIYARAERRRRRRAEDELVAAREAIKTATAAKTEFLTGLSREFRTPMNAILGMAKFLTASRLDAKQRKSVATLVAAGRSLSIYLDGVLDLSNFESAFYQVRQIPFDVDQTVRDEIEILRAGATAKGVSLSLEIDSATPATLAGDADKIRCVLANLINNSIKFTDHGGIEVSLRYIFNPTGVDDGGARNDPDGALEIEVKDSGVGIPPELRLHMFDDFVQGDAAASRHPEGSGLGLTVARRLVERMQGEIVHADGQDGGAIFVFTLPLPIAAAGIKSPSSPPALQVLVADDDPPSAMVAKGYLDMLGHTATVVGNGAEALQSVRQGGFDLVLMDLQMPEMSGIEAATQIRALDDPACANIPMIALTADVTYLARDAALESGMNATLHKPLSPESLEAALLALFAPNDDAPDDDDDAPDGGDGLPKLIDHQSIERMTADLGADQVAVLLDKARTSYLDMTGALRRELRAPTLDVATIGKIVHRLTGTAAAAGMPLLAEDLRDLEAAISGGENTAELDARIARSESLAVRSFQALGITIRIPTPNSD